MNILFEAEFSPAWHIIVLLGSNDSNLYKNCVLYDNCSCTEVDE